MIFETKESQCLHSILSLLDKETCNYRVLFKKTKVSHTTLQKVLKELAHKKFIIRNDLGHQNVQYKITEKGRILLKQLISLKEILA